MRKYKWIIHLLLVLAMLVPMLQPTPHAGGVKAQSFPSQKPPGIPDEVILFENLTRISPDGMHALYVTAKDPSMEGSTIWIADLNEGRARELVHGGSDFWVTNPIWAPDSQQIAYLKVIGSAQLKDDIDDRFEIWVINPDGTGHSILVDGPPLNPSLGYGGEANIVWNAKGEIEFNDQSTVPPKRYAMDIETHAFRELRGIQPSQVTEQPSNVPYFSQCDRRWRDNQLGYCSSTICTHGCAITAVAMVLKYFRADIDPGRFNTWLKKNGGYDVCKGGGRCCIKWDKAAHYAPHIAYIPNTSPNWNRLNRELEAGYPVIVEVRYRRDGQLRRHFVVVTHRQGHTYYINDSGHHKSTLASYGNNFTRMIVYHGPRRNTDHTPPHTDITINALSSNEWPTWFTSAVNVHLHATDQGGAGVKEIHYRLDGGAWQTVTGSDTTFTVSSDGNHSLDFYAVDEASSANQENTRTVTFNIDATPPTAPGNIVEGHGATYGVWQSTINDPDFTWGEATDATSGVYYYRIEWNNASNFSPTPAYDPPPVHTGSYVLTVRAVDYAGNVGPATSFRFNYDGTPPHAPDIQNLDGVASGVWQNQVRIPHFSWDEPQDAGAGIAGYYIYWGEDANGTTTTLTTTQSFALDTPICGPNEVASYYLRLRSQDKMGWQSDWVVFTFNYDGVPPTASLIANYGQEVVHQTRVHLDISASDLGSGVSGIRLSNEGRVWSDWLEPVDELTWEIPSVGQREYDIYLQVRDLAGNVSEIVSDTVYLDVNVPRPHSETYDLWDGAVVGGGNTSTTTQHILNTTIQWHHAPTSVGQQYQMVSGFQAASQAAPTETPTTTQQYIQLGSLISSGGTGATPLQSSNYQLHGSLGQPSDMQVITGTQYVAKLGYWGGVATDVETEGPPPPPPPPAPECEFFSISINNGALYTNRPEVTLNVCGPDAEQIMLSNDGGFSSATWQPYTRTLSWTLTTYGNYVLPRYVYARFKSGDGNIHGTFFDDIIYDPHAPDTAAAFDPSQLLPGTHRPTGIEAVQRVNTDQVELFVSAQDDNSGLDEIQVSLRPDFADAEWQAFSSIIPITFTQEGLQRVYIRTRDRAQNESSIASADIIIDRTPPTATVRMQDAIIGPDAISVTLLVTATDALGKVTAMQISTDPAMTDTIWVTYTPKVVLYPDLTRGLTPTLYIRLRDEAGNESPVYTATYTVDVTPPWGTVDIAARGETTATLHFSMEDDLSGVTEIMFSPLPWFSEDTTQQPYTDQVTWDFGNDSEVYVSFNDGVGNWSAPYWVPLRDVPPMTITASASPAGVVSSDNQITYTLSISTATGTDLTVYDPLIASTFVRFTQPISGIVYADGAITGSLTVTPTTPVTISFVVQVNISDTLPSSPYVSNSACIYPAWSTSYNCVWSNDVINLLQHDYSIYLPLVLRNR